MLSLANTVSATTKQRFLDAHGAPSSTCNLPVCMLCGLAPHQCLGCCRFYPIAMLFLQFMLIIFQRDFGPMFAAERRSHRTGKVYADDADKEQVRCLSAFGLCRFVCAEVCGVAPHPPHQQGLRRYDSVKQQRALYTPCWRVFATVGTRLASVLCSLESELQGQAT